MPEIGLPPWLQAARPAPLYAQGMQIGLEANRQRIAAQEAQQRMALEAIRQQNAMAELNQKMQLEEERMALNRELTQQELDVKQALGLGELGLREREFGLRERFDTAKMTEAAERLSAARRFQERVAAGEDPTDVLLEMGPLLNQQTAQAAAIRAQRDAEKNARPPELYEVAPGVQAVWNPQTGAFQMLHESPQMTDYQRNALIGREQDRLSKLYADNQRLLRKAPGELTDSDRQVLGDIEATRQRMQALQTPTPRRTLGTGTSAGAALPAPTAPAPVAPTEESMMPPDLPPSGLQVGRVRIGASRAAGAPSWPVREEEAAAPAGAPLPASKAELVTGTLYQTRYGPMVWNGKKFVKP